VLEMRCDAIKMRPDHDMYIDNVSTRAVTIGWNPFEREGSVTGQELGIGRIAVADVAQPHYQALSPGRSHVHVGSCRAPDSRDEACTD